MMITLNIFTFILIIAFVIIIYKYLETYWSYSIPKPFQWDNSLEDGSISKKIIQQERAYHDKIRLYILWNQVSRIINEKVEGDFAELGVHKGETAKLIIAANGTRKMHLFDTFEGFDEKDLKLETKKGGRYTTNEFSDTNVELVKKYLNADEKVIFHKGYFPETAKGLEDVRFSFVHLDADLYLPTLEGLKFFYPRLSPGGTIIIHDYNHIWDGVRKALEEFLPGIPECLVELPDWKGSAMIIKNKG